MSTKHFGHVTMTNHKVPYLSTLRCHHSSQNQLQVDARFVAEIVLVKQSMEHLAELTGYTNDGAPDVYIFTFSTLRVRWHLMESMCCYGYCHVHVYNVA